MKRLFFFIAFIGIGVAAFTQKVHVNTFLGIASYQGDMQKSRFTFSQARLGAGLGLSYEITDQFLLRGGYMTGKITADDKLNSRTSIRNLNFTSKISEGNLMGEYYFRNLYQFSLSPYIFGGVAIYHFDPYTKDSLGTKYYLKPLSTEGQGFVAGVNNYKLTQFAIPFGAGIKFALSDNVRLGFEIGMRKLFTDYIDDLSTNYVDENLLLLNRGAKAVELAFRGDELKNGSTYPAAGKQRGRATARDLYYFSGINLSFRLPADGGSKSVDGNRGKGGSKMGCPTRIY
jgi:opacity protein-like surface antigen